MLDPSPAYCFTVPSICDSIPLECRIYHPASFEGDEDVTKSAPLFPKKAAIVAHPYAPLGGSFDDPVVMIVVEQLLDLNFIVGTFNFRGASNSKGSTSWTGKAERDDYMSVAGHMIFYMNHLELPYSTLERSSDPRTAHSGTINLVLGGYSYGSLVLTQLPPVTDILQQFNITRSGEAANEILHRASTLASQTNEDLIDLVEARGRQAEVSKDSRRGHVKSNSHHSIVYGGNETPSPTGKDRNLSIDLVRKSIEMPGRLRHAIRRSSKSTTPTLPYRSPSTEAHCESPSLTKEGQGTKSLPHVKAHYLLVSPLLPPLSNFLSLSTTSMSLFRKPTASADTLIRNPTLAVFGSTDVFTSAHKLQAWGKKMQALSESIGSESRFRWKEVEGGGHFWRERGVAVRLREVLREWVGDVIMPE